MTGGKRVNLKWTECIHYNEHSKHNKILKINVKLFNTIHLKYLYIPIKILKKSTARLCMDNPYPTNVLCPKMTSTTSVYIQVHFRLNVIIEVNICTMNPDQTAPKRAF